MSHCFNLFHQTWYSHKHDICLLSWSQFLITNLFHNQIFNPLLKKHALCILTLFLKCDHIQLPELYILTKYREIDMDFTIFGSSPKNFVKIVQHLRM